jgi:catechol 2,3-dioxygenase-like lactoylglutathione lyase family enzyme
VAADDSPGSFRLDPARPVLDIGLVTAERDEAIAFYREVLGFMPCGGAAHRLRFGAQCIEWIQPEVTPPRQPSGLYDGTGYRVLGLLVDDLDAICERIEARGRRVAEGVDLPGRLRIRFAKDVDGNMLELIGLPEPAGPALRDRIQIGLTVADAARTRTFYARELGLPEHPDVPMGEGMTRYSVAVGGTTLKFWQRPVAPPRLGGTPLAAIGIRYTIASLTDAENTVAALTAHGLRVEPAPQALGPAVVACLVDPDDCWIALREAAD